MKPCVVRGFLKRVITITMTNIHTLVLSVIIKGHIMLQNLTDDVIDYIVDRYEKSMIKDNRGMSWFNTPITHKRIFQVYELPLTELTTIEDFETAIDILYSRIKQFGDVVNVGKHKPFNFGIYDIICNEYLDPLLLLYISGIKRYDSNEIFMIDTQPISGKVLYSTKTYITETRHATIHD